MNAKPIFINEAKPGQGVNQIRAAIDDDTSLWSSHKAIQGHEWRCNHFSHEMLLLLLSLKFKNRFTDPQIFFWNEVVHEIALSFPEQMSRLFSQSIL